MILSKNAYKLRLASVAAITPALLASATFAGTSTNTSGSPSRNDTPGSGAKNNAITVSFSGQTALRGFSAGAGFTFLTPGTSITLNNGANGSPITYTATDTGSTAVQLASPNFTLSDTGVDYSGGAPDKQRHSALRIEWHEQGSGDGLIDLLNDQIGFAGGVGGTPQSNVASRGPSTSNPTWVNTNQFTTGNTLNGFTLAAGNFANTYDVAVYDRATGRNLQGGQDRVQFSVGEYKTESLAAASGTPSVNAKAGTSGYGRGNPALAGGATVDALGTRGARQQLRSAAIANQSTDKIDPQSTSNANYVAGPWNNAGADNIDSKQIAVTAVSLAANPGTGISRINLSDAQWLQTASRLQNGADFNVATRTANTGQRVVAALNTGVDPSWAVGENDDGNTSGSAAAAAQRSIGPGFRLSGKTSGTEARNAIAQSRLGFGALSLAEARGTSAAAPLRTLDVAFNDLVDPTIGGSIDASKFVHLNFDSIVNFQYKTVLISHYNTVKQARTDLLATYRSSFQTVNGRAPTGAEESTWWAGLTSEQTGIKGDTTGAVRSVINNVTASTGTAAQGLTASTISNAADSLFLNGFLIPQLLNYSRQTDGGVLTPNALNAQQLQLQQNVKSFYGNAFTADGTPGATTSTIGTGATYGALGTSEPVLGAVPITNNNYLFGNFNQDGRRDFASVKEAVNAALSLRATERAANIANADSSLFRGVNNGTAVATLSGAPGWASAANTKGDLIVLGDFNSDGAFDGQDVYLLARGASVSDAAGGDHLTTASGANFGDQVRNPNAKLNKNAALDFAQASTANASSADQQFLRRTARAVLSGTTLPAGATQISSAGGVITYTFDPNGDNAFNKFDVNRDGRVSLDDAHVVDSFTGKDYHNLADTLGAVVRTDTNPGGAAFASDATLLDPTDPANSSIPRRAISLVDVELTDNGVITAFGSGSDFGLIRAALGAALKAGDSDFDGDVDFSDLLTLARNYGRSADRWSSADFDLSGVTNFDDLLGLAKNYGSGTGAGLATSDQFASDWALAQSIVPEPTSLLAAMGLLSGFVRRARVRTHT